MLRPDSPEPCAWLDTLAQSVVPGSSPALILAGYPERVRVDNVNEDRDDRYFGVMTDLMAQQLVEVLADFTATPHECLFAVWDGYVTEPGAPLGRSYTIGWHDFRIFFGALRDVVALSNWVRGQTPNYAWPQDRRWCWISDIDLPVTYLGGPVGLADALATKPALQGAVHPEGAGPASPQ